MHFFIFCVINTKWWKIYWKFKHVDHTVDWTLGPIYNVFGMYKIKDKLFHKIQCSISNDHSIQCE
jgi:hypothetical protein